MCLFVQGDLKIFHRVAAFAGMQMCRMQRHTLMACSFAKLGLQSSSSVWPGLLKCLADVQSSSFAGPHSWEGCTGRFWLGT